jgi:peptide chain release factor 2
MSYHNTILGVYLSVLAGAGGDDAKDWADMLFRMYVRYADRKGWKTTIIDDRTIHIKGEGVYDVLKLENGVHRLVRISPFDAKKLRHTSFALVELIPAIPTPELSSVRIPEKDLKMDFFRSSGPGGQNVNKVETAVRIVHLPTGIVASSQSERAQSANRDRALEIIKIKLLELMKERHETAVENLRVKVKPEWGHEIRSYVLHPYKQVKDHRTGEKNSRVEEVLGGNLDLILGAR